MACQKHGYENPTFCPACDQEAIAEHERHMDKAWDELRRLAKEINPDLPDDLGDKEIRITFTRDFQSVEVIDWTPQR